MAGCHSGNGNQDIKKSFCYFNQIYDTIASTILFINIYNFINYRRQYIRNEIKSKVKHVDWMVLMSVSETR